MELNLSNFLNKNRDKLLEFTRNFADELQNEINKKYSNKFKNELDTKYSNKLSNKLDAKYSNKSSNELDEKNSNQLNEKSKGKFVDIFKEKKMEKDNKSELEIGRREGETYTVDEIGDDEKYVFLTRESDGKDFQEFNISDELYRALLNDDREELRVKFENGEYHII